MFKNITTEHGLEMHPKDMTPILPYTVWRKKEFGLIKIVSSCVLPDGRWEVCFEDKFDGIYIIDIDGDEWIRDVEFVQGQIYSEDEED
jgi:hypothetical protein